MQGITYKKPHLDGRMCCSKPVELFSIDSAFPDVQADNFIAANHPYTIREWYRGAPSPGSSKTISKF